MKSIVLLSSGLDSTVNFCKALRAGEIVLALTFDYGQKAAFNEVTNSKRICQKYYVPHEVVQLEWLKKITKTALVNSEKPLPELQEQELDQLNITLDSAEKVWVPNRNGVFLNIAASFAESIGADTIVVGFNAEEAKTFPDNTDDYVKSVNAGFQFSTLKHPKVICYTQDLNKTEIVRLGKELRAPFDLMWSCYRSGLKPCQKCESCLRYYRALREADSFEKH